MKCVTIEPAKTRWDLVEATSLKALFKQLALDNRDFGVIAPPGVLPSGVGVTIVVDGFSLFQPKEAQRYFAIGRHLFAGNAVLYGFDQMGETVDLEDVPVVLFMTLKGVEAAIAHGQIDRPAMAVNGEQVWEWPEPSPYQEH